MTRWATHVWQFCCVGARRITTLPYFNEASWSPFNPPFIYDIHNGVSSCQW